jgi:hypothetical protein
MKKVIDAVIRFLFVLLLVSLIAIVRETNYTRSRLSPRIGSQESNLGLEDSSVSC